MARAIESGPALDEAVWSKLGRPGPMRPQYSSHDPAAAALERRMRLAGYRLEAVREGGEWFCVWHQNGARLSSGSGPTRAVALCRATVNLRLPRYWWARGEEGGLRRPSACEDCGEPVPLGRGALRRFCNRCSWEKTRWKIASS